MRTCKFNYKTHMNRKHVAFWRLLPSLTAQRATNAMQKCKGRRAFFSTGLLEVRVSGLLYRALTRHPVTPLYSSPVLQCPPPWWDAMYPQVKNVFCNACKSRKAMRDAEALHSVLSECLALGQLRCRQRFAPSCLRRVQSDASWCIRKLVKTNGDSVCRAMLETTKLPPAELVSPSISLASEVRH